MKPKLIRDLAELVKSHTAAELMVAADMLKDETRNRIFALLSNGPLCVLEICRKLGTSQPTVSHHLGLMRIRGMVVTQRQGKRVLYSLAG